MFLLRKKKIHFFSLTVFIRQRWNSSLSWSGAAFTSRVGILTTGLSLPDWVWCLTTGKQAHLPSTKLTSYGIKGAEQFKGCSCCRWRMQISTKLFCFHFICSNFDFPVSVHERSRRANVWIQPSELKMWFYHSGKNARVHGSAWAPSADQGVVL